MERLTIRNSDGSVSQPTATTIQAVFEKLAAYEDLEEQGRLAVLPCKTDTIWIVEEATHDCDTVPDKDCMARPNCKGCPALKSYVRRIDTFYFTRAEAEKAMVSG